MLTVLEILPLLSTSTRRKTAFKSMSVISFAFACDKVKHTALYSIHYFFGLLFPPTSLFKMGHEFLELLQVNTGLLTTINLI